MLRAFALLTVAVAVVSSIPAQACLAPPAVPTKPDPPSVTITKNDDFKASWAVKGGTGSAEDPYRIQDAQIVVDERKTGYVPTAIWITGTTAHFVIQNVTIRDDSLRRPGYGSCCQPGIRLYNVTNARIEGVLVEGTQQGIEIGWSSGVTMRNSMIKDAGQGILLRGSTDVTLANNKLINSSFTFAPYRGAPAAPNAISEDNTIDGLPVYFRENCDGERAAHRNLGTVILAGCTNFSADDLVLAGRGQFEVWNAANLDLRRVSSPFVSFHNVSDVRLSQSNVASLSAVAFRNLSVEDSKTMDGAMTAVRLENGTGTRIERNDFRGHRILDVGVHVDFWCGCLGPEPPVGVPRAIIANNTLSDGKGSAVKLGDSEAAEVRDNRILNHSIGVEAGMEPLVKIERNLVEGSGYGPGIAASGDRAAVRNNTVSGFEVAVQVGSSVEVVDNHLNATSAAVTLGRGDGALVSRNDMWRGGIAVDDNYIDHLRDLSLGPGNTVNGLPVAFHSGCDGVAHEGEALGQVIVSGCANVSLRNLSFGDTSHPVTLVRTQHFEIENLTTDTASSSVNLWSVWEGTVANSSFKGNSTVDVYDAANLTFAGNQFSEGNGTLQLRFVDGARIQGNRFDSPGWGAVSLFDAYGVTMRGNSFAAGGLELYGDAAWAYDSHDIDETNSVAGLPILYVAGKRTETVQNRELAQLIIANCTDLTIRDTHVGTAAALGSWGSAIRVAESQNVSFDQVSAFAGGRGLEAENVRGLRIRGGTFETTPADVEGYGGHAVFLHAVDAALEGVNLSSPGGYGIYAETVGNLSITDGAIDSGVIYGAAALSQGIQVERTTFSGWAGLQITSVFNLTVRESTFSGPGGISLGSVMGGVVEGNHFVHQDRGALWIQGSSSVEFRRNTIELGASSGIRILRGNADLKIHENNISNNDAGLWVETDGPRVPPTQGTVLIFNNTFERNRVGIAGNATPEVVVYHNRFVNNTVQARISGGGSYDAGYLIGGNYWSDYAGVDHCTGPNQDECSGSDQYGDTPYCLGAPEGISEGSDRYPLMTTVPPPARTPPPAPPPEPPKPTSLDPISAGLPALALILAAVAAGIFLSLRRKPVEKLEDEEIERLS